MADFHSMYKLMKLIKEHGMWISKGYELAFWLQSADHQPQYIMPHHIIVSEPFFEVFSPFIFVKGKHF